MGGMTAQPKKRTPSEEEEDEEQEQSTAFSPQTFASTAQAMPRQAGGRMAWSFSCFFLRPWSLEGRADRIERAAGLFFCHEHELSRIRNRREQ